MRIPRPAASAGGWRISRVGGVDILIKPSLLVMGVILVAVFAPRFEQRSDDQPYVLAIVFVVALYASVLVHELAHVAAARYFRMNVHSVTLHLLGGETIIEGESRTPWQELATAISGPLASLAIGLAASGLSRGIDGTTGDILWSIGYVNIIVAIFNMLPGLPLDGGRVFRALVWQVTGREDTGIRAAARIGQIAAVLAVVFAITRDRDERQFAVTLAMALVIAWFLWQGSSEALRAVDHATRTARLDARILTDPGLVALTPPTSTLPIVTPRETPMTDPTRHGPLAPGEWVRLSDPKGRKHNVRLEAGKAFSTKKGQISHDDMIGRSEGIVIESSMGAPYQVFRPLLFEYVVSMPRGAAIIYPKDAAQIVTMADIFPGARVVEAGAGSGSLTTYLLRAIGPGGTLGSYEIRDEFAENVTRNVEQVAGPSPAGWTLTVGDVRECITETEIDRLVLDMVDPWTCIPLAAERLVPGGIVCAYVATTTQLSLFVESIRADGGFTEPRAWETIEREWHLEGLAVRPDHRMVGHTAFLVTARRMAAGVQSLEKSRRPAPGAYGPDYHGPRPAGFEAE